MVENRPMSAAAVVAIVIVVVWQLFTNVVATMALLSAWGALREVRDLREEHIRLWAIVTLGKAATDPRHSIHFQGGAQTVQGGASAANRGASVGSDVRGDFSML